MKPPVERHDLVAQEREIQSLSEKSGASPAEVRTLFDDELARLKMGAKVGSYLGVLTASNVRGMLRRKTRLASQLVDKAAVDVNAGLPVSRHLHCWEDDGGSVRPRAEW